MDIASLARVAEPVVDPVVHPPPPAKPPAKAPSTADALGTLIQREGVTVAGGVVQRSITNELNQLQKPSPPAKAKAAKASATTVATPPPAAPAPAVTKAAPAPAAPPPVPTFLRDGVAIPLDAAHDLTPEQLERIEARQARAPVTNWDPLK